MELATVQDLTNWRKLIVEDIKKLLKQEDPKPKEKWIKSKEARELLSCSAGTLNSLKDELKHAKIHGTLYWEYYSILDMLEKASFKQTTALA